MDRTLLQRPPQTVISAPAEGSMETTPLVITISREYGSGGHEVGEKLAKKLGVKLYDKDPHRYHSQRIGISAQLRAGERTEHFYKQLWELIFTDKSIPMSMNPSEDDAIFVSQSRTIKKVAME